VSRRNKRGVPAIYYSKLGLLRGDLDLSSLQTEPAKRVSYVCGLTKWAEWADSGAGPDSGEEEEYQ
jgi:hypothetical protein